MEKSKINLLKLFFPNLKFRLFKKHKKRNFYFNIRTIIKQQDIIIDYISNYSEIINTIDFTQFYDNYEDSKLPLNFPNFFIILSRFFIPCCNAKGLARLVYTIPFMWSSSWRKHLADIPESVVPFHSPV